MDLTMYLIVLVNFDILLRLFFWYTQYDKAPPMSFLEYFMTNEDTKDFIKELINQLINIINECNEETRRFFFEEIRRRDKRDSEIHKNKRNDESNSDDDKP